MNLVILKGRLTNDPEVRYTQSGKAVANFSIATNNNVKDDNGKYGADFHNCTAWGKTAETVGNHLTKGSEIALEGRLKTDSYDKDGQKRYKTYVLVGRIEFCCSKRNDSQLPTGAESFGSEVFPDEDIPF